MKVDVGERISDLLFVFVNLIAMSSEVSFSAGVATL